MLLDEIVQIHFINHYSWRMTNLWSAVLLTPISCCSVICTISLACPVARASHGPEISTYRNIDILAAPPSPAFDYSPFLVWFCSIDHGYFSTFSVVSQTESNDSTIRRSHSTADGVSGVSGLSPGTTTDCTKLVVVRLLVSEFRWYLDCKSAKFWRLDIYH